jgi:hypothetical protein
MPPTPTPQTRVRAQAFADFMDSAFRLPGTSIRFGWDNLLGLIPGVGDTITLILSFYVLAEAAYAGAPASVLMRMLINAGIDSTFGLVPFLGDLFDVAFKANRRNAQVLLDWLDQPRRVQNESRIRVAIVFVVGLSILAAMAVASVLIAAWLWRLLTQ